MIQEFYIFVIDLTLIKMRFSKTSEYALRILTFMAREPEKMRTAKFLIEKLKISDKYLRRLMTDLSKAGFIKSIQGRDGGYVLCRETSEIHISEIIDAVEGMDKYCGCVLGFDECSEENPCLMHTTWSEIREKFVTTFSDKTLGELDFEGNFKY